MTPCIVTLSPVEMALAATAGGIRHAESLMRGRRDAHGLPEEADGLRLHVDGAAGEIAVAKLLGRYWGGDVGTFKRADLGRGVQVRTRSRHDYELLVRPDDPDDHAFVLVTGSPPRLAVRGWIWGQEAKRPEWLRTHGGRPPAYFVPTTALRPLLPRREARAA